jgi:Xaa-Pro dipeptidase
MFVRGAVLTNIFKLKRLFIHMLNIFINTTETRKDPTIQYIAGCSPSFCLLAYDSKSGKKCMFVSSFEVGSYKNIKTYAFNPDTFKSKILRHFSIRALNQIGVNYSCLSVKAMKTLRKMLKAKLIDISEEFGYRREIKTKSEICKISAACKIADRIFFDLMKSRFRTEVDAARFIKKRILDFGVEAAFDPVVATSTNSTKPHHIPSSQKMKGFTIIDFGVKYCGYCCDMTRTVYYGNPSEREIEEYNSVLLVQNDAISALRENVKLAKIDLSARAVLGKVFIHALGHGVGVEIHELPLFSSKTKSKLREGMVFAIEPGVYHKGEWGIRIEDTVAFINGRARVLTKSPKHLIVKRLSC